MEFKEFLENNYSERDYDKRMVELDILDELMSYAKETANSQELKKVHFKYFDNGNPIFSKLNGSGGYSGYMINSPHYIGIEVDDDTPLTDIITGYSGQAVIKKAFELGLMTCWIDLKDVPEEMKSALADNPGRKVNYLIALGYSDKKREPSKNTAVQDCPVTINNPSCITVAEGGSTSGGRLSTEEIVYLDSWGNNIDYNELENRGLVDLFYYVKNAPSYKNQQPWRFIIKGGEIVMGVLNPRGEGTYTDAGIMMFMIEGMAREMSIPGKWQYLEPEVFNHDGALYAIVGKFDI